MTLAMIAVQGMTLATKPATVAATVTAAPPTGTKCKATALIHRDGDKVTVTAITVPTAGATIADPGPYVVGLVATAEKVKAEGIAVVLEGDETEEVNATPQIPGSPPTDYPVTFTVKVSAAGQQKAKAQ